MTQFFQLLLVMGVWLGLGFYAALRDRHDRRREIDQSKPKSPALASRHAGELTAH